MTTLSREPVVEAAYRGLRMTADEYLALPETFERYELIDGVICMSPSPSRWHQQIINDIAFQLTAHLETHPVGAAMSQIDVRLEKRLVYRPDVLYLSHEKLAQCASKITVPPDIVVEVISPDSLGVDMKTKKHDYERFGVTEYWVIDPIRRRFHFFRLEEGKYVEVQPGTKGLASSVLHGFVLNLGRIEKMFG